jgi:PAS domain S-box-containing protein
MEKWITPRQTRRRKMDELASTFATFGGKLDEVAAQLRTNGGSSVKDMVMRIDSKVENIQARVRYQDETSPIAIFELDGNGSMTFANCTFRELVNSEEQDLSHRNYLSRVHPDDRTRLIRELQEAIDNKMPIDSTVRFRLDGRKFLHVRLLANSDVRPDGTLMGFFGTASTIDGITDEERETLPPDCPLK